LKLCLALRRLFLCDLQTYCQLPGPLWPLEQLCLAMQRRDISVPAKVYRKQYTGSMLRYRFITIRREGLPGSPRSVSRPENCFKSIVSAACSVIFKWYYVRIKNKEARDIRSVAQSGNNSDKPASLWPVDSACITRSDGKASPGFRENCGKSWLNF